MFGFKPRTCVCTSEGRNIRVIELEHIVWYSWKKKKMIKKRWEGNTIRASQSVGLAEEDATFQSFIMIFPLLATCSNSSRLLLLCLVNAASPFPPPSPPCLWVLIVTRLLVICVTGCFVKIALVTHLCCLNVVNTCLPPWINKKGNVWQHYLSRVFCSVVYLSLSVCREDVLSVPISHLGFAYAKRRQKRAPEKSF